MAAFELEPAQLPAPDLHETTHGAQRITATLARAWWSRRVAWLGGLGFAVLAAGGISVVASIQASGRPPPDAPARQDLTAFDVAIARALAGVPEGAPPRSSVGARTKRPEGQAGSDAIARASAGVPASAPPRSPVVARSRKLEGQDGDDATAWALAGGAASAPAPSSVVAHSRQPEGQDGDDATAWGLAGVPAGAPPPSPVVADPKLAEGQDQT
jgi:hypothetical protein